VESHLIVLSFVQKIFWADFARLPLNQFPIPICQRTNTCESPPTPHADHDHGQIDRNEDEAFVASPLITFPARAAFVGRATIHRFCPFLLPTGRGKHFCRGILANANSNRGVPLFFANNIFATALGDST
jgi:hypothetical protein